MASLDDSDVEFFSEGDEDWAEAASYEEAWGLLEFGFRPGASDVLLPTVEASAPGAAASSSRDSYSGAAGAALSSTSTPPRPSLKTAGVSWSVDSTASAAAAAAAGSSPEPSAGFSSVRHAQGALETPPKHLHNKRARISGKTSPKDLAFQYTPKEALEPDWAAHKCYRAFFSASAQEQKKALTALRVRKHRVLQHFHDGIEVTLNGQEFALPKNEELRESMTERLQVAFMHEVAKDSGIASMIRGCAMKQLLSLPPGTTVDTRVPLDPKALRKKSMLLTYQGDWGLLPLSVLGDDCDASGLDGVLEKLRECSQVQEMQRDFDQHFSKLRKAHLVDHWQVALELCCDTWHKNRTIRVHGHAWVVKSLGGLQESDMTFQGQAPWINWDAMEYFGGRGSRSLSAAYAGHFYLWVEKSGSIARFGSLEAYKNYAVKDYWITNLYTAGKISAGVAKTLYCEATTRAEMNVKQLAFVEKLKQEQQDAEDQRQVEIQQRLQQRAFRRFAVVDDWLAQYEHVRGRYKFLVLVGPSQTGKTRYARSFAGEPDRIWYADCSGGCVDLRGYSVMKHEVIIFDEITPELAISCKKVMQASNDMCSLAMSPTLQYAYNVRTYRKKLVLCSNTWLDNMMDLPHADQEWLRDNSFVLASNEPLYE